MKSRTAGWCCRAPARMSMASGWHWLALACPGLPWSFPDTPDWATTERRETVHIFGPATNESKQPQLQLPATIR